MSTPGQKRFKAPVRSGERGRIYVEIPFDPHEAWGRKARHYVEGTIAGASFNGSLGTRGGVFFMPLNQELRTRAGVNPGDTVSVVMAPADAAKPAIPAELAAALEAEPSAKRAFAALTPFRQNELVKSISGAKREETRDRRIAQAIAELRS